MQSIDIFYVVLAFCVLWLAVFLCWFIYQIVVTIKTVNDVVRELKWQIEKIEQVLSGMKSKFEVGSGHLAKLAGSVKKVVDEFKDKKI